MSLANNIISDYKESKTEKSLKATVESIKATNIAAKGEKLYSGKEITSKDLSAYIRSNFSGTISDNVTKLLDNTVDSIIQDRIKASTKSAQEKYTESVNLYNKIYNSEKLLTEMKTRYTDNLIRVTENKTKDIASKITNPLNKNPLTKGLVDNSALNKQINSFVNSVVSSAVDGIASDEDISVLSKQVKTEMDTIKNNGIKYAKKQLGSELAYAAKVSGAAKDMVSEVEKRKQQYLKNATDALNEQKAKINAAVRKMEEKATAEINKVVKSLVSGIAKGIKLG